VGSGWEVLKKKDGKIMGWNGLWNFSDGVICDVCVFLDGYLESHF
jgi:hypothetical protein